MTTSKVVQTLAMLKNQEMTGMQKQSQESGLVFGALLNQTAGGSNQDLFSTESLRQTSKSDTANQTVYEKETAKSGYRENTISRNEPAETAGKLPQDAKEKLQTFDSNVRQVIAEKLGISEEDVAQQMEVMGLTVMDLMDPSKLASLVMELTGSEDIGSLLLSEDFQQMLSQINDLSQELALQLNLTPEEMKQIQEEIKFMLSQNPQGEVMQDGEELSQNVETISQDAKEVLPEQIRDDAVLQKNATADLGNASNPTEDVSVQNEARGENIKQEEGRLAEDVNVQENTGEQGEAGSTAGEKSSDLLQEETGNDKSENRQTHVTYQTTTQTVGQGPMAEVTQTVTQTRVDVEDIMRQVSQMTRVLVSQAESSIEMQLNPASLGKIYLQVLSREGVITAQIAAQNEAVKEALESQVMVLRENMNQQGLKVEAIEVTIASHEFERNLEENQQNAAREQQEEETAKSARRNLNLNNLDDLEGLMSEEETLVAKMMAEQGNSMDITA